MGNDTVRVIYEKYSVIRCIRVLWKEPLPHCFGMACDLWQQRNMVGILCHHLKLETSSPLWRTTEQLEIGMIDWIDRSARCLEYLISLLPAPCRPEQSIKAAGVLLSLEDKNDASKTIWVNCSCLVVASFGFGDLKLDQGAF